MGSDDPTTTGTTGRLDMTIMLAFHDALRRDLGHLARAAAWQGFAADQRRRNGIRGAAQLFPWLLDGASPEQIRSVLEWFPPPLRLVYRRLWQPRYARRAHWEPPTPA
jgi:hypothetical protein